MYKFALRNIWLKKSRSILALVGLSIAIIGIISLISISVGIKGEITGIFSKMEGVSVMEVGVLDDSQSKVSLDWVKKLESFPEVKTIVPVITGMAIDFEESDIDLSRGLTSIVAYIGIDPSEASKLQIGSLYYPKVISGRFLKSNDKNSVLLTEGLAEDYKKKVGSKVEFNGKEFTVVGIVDPESEMFNNLIFTSILPAQEMADRDSNIVNILHLDLYDPKDSDNLADKINFRYEDDDIEATSSSGFAGSIGGVLENLDLFLIGVSSIALMVGVIGILNTMLMSVMERTKEIGILKAVGWTSDNILQLIVFESIFLGLLGGAIGVILATFLVIFIANPLLPFPMAISADLIFYSFLVSIISGVVGGVYPAWKASKLDPVDAIRFE